MDWKSLIGNVAPLLATALGGPLAGLAVDSLGKAMGMSEPSVQKVKDALTQGQLTGDQIAQLRMAEQALQVRMQELGIQKEALELADVQSARAMQISTRSWTPEGLSWLIVAATIAIYTFLLRYGNPSDLDDIILGRILGTLDMAFGVVLAFWLGTSNSSRSKDATISNLTK